MMTSAANPAAVTNNQAAQAAPAPAATANPLKAAAAAQGAPTTAALNAAADPAANAKQGGDFGDAIARFTGLSLSADAAGDVVVPPSSVEASMAGAANNGEEQGADGASGATPTAGHSWEEGDAGVLALRSLVSTKEAGVIIGKGGKNVAAVREATGVKAGVSKVVPGVHERVLTVVGPVAEVARAFGIIAQNLLDNPNTTTPPSAITHTPPANPNTTTVRLLIGHQLMGSIIGKQGAKIKEIQEQTGSKIIISKEMLPQSTERVLEITGIIDAITHSVHLISECILNDFEKSHGVITYNPGSPAARNHYAANGAGAPGGPSAGYDNHQFRQHHHHHPTGNPAQDFAGGYQRVGGGHQNNHTTTGSPMRNNGVSGPRRNYPSSSTSTHPRGGMRGGMNAGAGANVNASTGANSPVNTNRFNAIREGGLNSGEPEVDPETGMPIELQTLSIPADLCGCIIGRGGETIKDIRERSGSRISISKRVNRDNGERLFMVRGTAEANERALCLLYERLAEEKERRQREEPHGHHGHQQGTGEEHQQGEEEYDAAAEGQQQE